MNSVSFNGLYRVQTMSQNSDSHKSLENQLREEFSQKSIEANIWAGSRPGGSKSYLTDTQIISYGTPDQDYEILQKVFGKDLIQPWILTEARKKFGEDFMKTFKSAVQQFIDKSIKDLDTDIEDIDERTKLREKLLATQDKAGFVTDEFCENAMDIGNDTNTAI